MLEAFFLDRDGVIIENRAAYVRSWADVEIFPQAIEALRQMASQPIKIVLVTNQSAVGRGIISLETAQNINRRLLAYIEEAGGRIDGIYMCPHAPQDDCNCRKPRPGMLLQAAVELDIDLSRSIMIGDAVTDLKAGVAAGVGAVALLKTGRGREQLQQLAAEPELAFHLYDDLAHAYTELLGRDR